MKAHRFDNDVLRRACLVITNSEWISWDSNQDLVIEIIELDKEIAGMAEVLRVEGYTDGSSA